MKRIALFACLLLANSYPINANGGLTLDESSHSVSDITVLKKQFGLFSITPSGVEFSPADTVPLIEGQHYGWRLRLNTDRKKITMREEFELPKAPKTWGTPVPGLSISKDGKTATTERTLEIQDGLIQSSWSVADGDPAGEYKIRLYIDDELVAKFSFTAK